jgi:hypothetical protein
MSAPHSPAELQRLYEKLGSAPKLSAGETS